ncbi:MAG TPA: hypothetical protein VLA72_17335 [Anaerolineales bacterium]|nr:hypothetical protein [Anaerolineales bacterium]
MAWLARDNNFGGFFSTPTPTVTNTFTPTNTPTLTATNTLAPLWTATKEKTNNDGGPTYPGGGNHQQCRKCQSKPNQLYPK